MVVNLHSRPVISNPGSLEIEPIDIRQASCGHQHLIECDFAAAAGALKLDDFLVFCSFRVLNLTILNNLDPVTQQCTLYYLRRIGILARQNTGFHFEQGNLRTKASEGLCQFAAERPAADYSQSPGQSG